MHYPAATTRHLLENSFQTNLDLRCESRLDDCVVLFTQAFLHETGQHGTHEYYGG